MARDTLCQSFGPTIGFIVPADLSRWAARCWSLFERDLAGFGRQRPLCSGWERGKALLTDETREAAGGDPAASWLSGGVGGWGRPDSHPSEPRKLDQAPP